MSARDCIATSHEWPQEWQDGDTCNCGQFSLTTDDEGGVRIDEAAEPDEDDTETPTAVDGGA
jgi:hypothetical protein